MEATQVARKQQEGTAEAAPPILETSQPETAGLQAGMPLFMQRLAVGGTPPLSSTGQKPAMGNGFYIQRQAESGEADLEEEEEDLQPEVVQTKCACGGTAGPDGECAACRKERLEGTVQLQPRSETPLDDEQLEEEPEREVQTKLVVNQPGDAYEQEANHIADFVIRQPKNSASQLPNLSKAPIGISRIQREAQLPELPTTGMEEEEPAAIEGATDVSGEAVAEGEREGEGPPADEAAKEAAETDKGGGNTVGLPDIEPPKEEEEPPPIQLQPQAPVINNNGNKTAGLQKTLHKSSNGGSPIPPAIRGEMEQHFGHDLSQVRIHNDGDAANMNQDLRAKAFTHRNHIYFNAGEYAPSSRQGKHLLAHELTHTIQQGATGEVIQRYAPPAQDVATEPKPEKPGDGAEVTGRMNQKINNDPDMKDPDDLSEEEKKKAAKPDRSEVRQESGEISSSGESKPAVDRGAQAKEKTEEQKAQIEAEMQEQAEEGGEEKAEGEGEEGGEVSASDAALQAAQAAEQQAAAVQIPTEPEPFRQPRVEAPVDSAGEPLPRNGQVDTQVSGLGYIGDMLRTKGYEMKRHSAEQTIGAFGNEAVLEKERADLANAREGTATMEAHNEGRKEIAAQSREAHGESVSRQQFVAEKAPDLAGKADEGREDSSELAGEASSNAERSAGEKPDDPDARADAEKQSGQMQSAADGAASMDQAIAQTGERARQYEADAAAAAEQNDQSEAQITETDETITKTETRITEMHAANDASQAQIDNVAHGPALIRQHAQQTAQSGDQLIAATIVMEGELNSLQDEYLAGMSGIESREAAIERQQKEQEEAQKAEMTPEEAQLLELAGLSDKEQEQRIAEMDQTQRNSLLATLERMIQQAPDQGTDATEGARLKVDTGLTQSIMGEQPADPRAPQIQAVDNKRIQRVGGVLDVADKNMVFLTAEQQRMLANKLVAESVTDQIKNINVLQMGKEMIKGMIDPRQSLVGIVGGFEKMLGGFANIGNWEAWQKDPLGNLLQIAADITTGLATIFSTILGLAGLIMAVMVALTILSWGFLSPVTGPVIAWMGTIMTYAGWGALIAGGLAVYFNYLAYIKNLNDAGTADTARELFGNTEQMKTNATDGFQGAMAVVEGVGAVKMGPALSSGKFFKGVPRSPGQWAGQMMQGAKQGLKTVAAMPAAVARGAKRLFQGGRRGLLQFKRRIQGLFRHRKPGAHVETLPDAGKPKTTKKPDGKGPIKSAEPEPKPSPKQKTHGDKPEIEEGIVAKEKTADGHEMKVTKDGKLVKCSECEIIELKYAEEIAADPKIKKRLDDIKAIEDPKMKAKKAAELEAELKQRKADADLESKPKTEPEPDSPEAATRPKKEDLLDESNTFKDTEIEERYQAYVKRNTRSGKRVRDRLEWLEESEYWQKHSPMARGNRFNKKAVRERPSDFHEVHLENGKRLDTYVPPNKIISRKATDFDSISESTLLSYCDEIHTKYPRGTKIRSNKYQTLDGQPLKGKYYLEVPDSNLSSPNFARFKAIARKKGVYIITMAE